MMPPSWIIVGLKLFGVAVNIINFLMQSMKEWPTRREDNSESHRQDHALFILIKDHPSAHVCFRGMRLV